MKGGMSDFEENGFLILKKTEKKSVQKSLLLIPKFLKLLNCN